MPEPISLPTGPVAVFDLDGTLVRHDTLLPFLVSFALRHRTYRRLLPIPFWLTLLALRIIPARRAKERLLTSVLRGSGFDALTEHAEWFWQNWLAKRLNAPVVAKLEEHRVAGDRVILVSASPDIYVPVIARHLGIDEVVCTEVERNGPLCGGRIAGDNCKGASKLLRLHAYLGTQQLPAGSSAYGDSASDLPLLRAVNHGFWVNGSVIKPVDKTIKKPARVAALTWLFPLLCLAVWLVFVRNSLAQTYPFSWDSAVYIEAAQSIVQGNGITHRTIGGVDLPLWEPMALWPPGYALLIAAIHAFGMPAPEAGVLVSLVSGGVFVLLQAWICLMVLDWKTAVPAALAASCMPALYQVSTNCLSDAAYMALSAGSLGCLLVWLKRPRPGWPLLACAGLLAGSAWATRNVGLALLAAEAGLLLLFSLWQSRRQTFTHLAVWSSAAGLVIVPVLVRNFVVFGRLNPYEMPPSNLSLVQNLKAAFASFRYDLAPLESNLSWLTPLRMAALLVLLTGFVVWQQRHRLKLNLLRELLARHAGTVLLLGYAILLTTVVVAARTKYWWGEPVHSRYLVPIYWIGFIAFAHLCTAVLAAARMSTRSCSLVVAALLFGLAGVQARAQLIRLAEHRPQLNPLSVSPGEPAAQFLAKTVRDDQIVLAGRADLLRVHFDLNARKIPGQPFSSVAYRREVTWDVVSRAGRQGHLWGIVIDDPMGARNGHYGQWIQQLIDRPDDYPDMERISIEGPAHIFRYNAQPKS